jgi:opacity protein-like surface antigen
MKKTLAAAWIFYLLSTASAVADTIQQQMGWAGWFNSDRLNERWGYLTDVQLRSSDSWDESQTLILRPGVSYFFDNKNNVSLGYAYIATLNNPGDNLVEHRIWQQYIHTQSWSRAAITQRLRLEQRFVEQQNGGDRLFSQRLRYLLRSVVPLHSEQSTFSYGPFFALQNELFFNVQHDEKVNGKLLDQNRLFVAVGYRLSSRYDLELGYLNQFVNGRVNDTMNHIVQFGLYSRF